MNSPNKITKRLTDPQDFPAQLTLPPAQSQYILDDSVRLAVRMAWATGRPLLVVGEVGCGKTQLAHALAAQWHVPCIAETIHARTEAQDLFFHFDAVARLSDAQMSAALNAQAQNSTRVGCDPLQPRHYLRPGALWWALNAPSIEMLNQDRPPQFKVQTREGLPEAWQGGANVVLIDEIDKGSDDLAESLLEVLDIGAFTVPWTGQRVKRSANAEPFLIITSNGARPLPPPFLRRCIVLAMQVPEGDALREYFVQRGKAHFDNTQIKVGAMQRAAELVAQDRESVNHNQRYKPGVAEFLLLCDAIANIAPSQSEQEQIGLIDALAPSVTTQKGEANAMR